MGIRVVTRGNNEVRECYSMCSRHGKREMGSQGGRVGEGVGSREKLEGKELRQREIARRWVW